MIDFPANPIPGQIFTVGGVSWVWDGLKWADAGAAAGAKITVAPTPPTAPPPDVGDLWFNSADTQLYIYFDGQWVITVRQDQRPDLRPPVNTAPPELSGMPMVGETITATMGEWQNDPTEFLYIGLRDGVVTGPGSLVPTYILQDIDVGAMVAVRVRAANQDGFVYAESYPIGPIEGLPVGPDPPPGNLTLPVVTGTPRVGSTLSSSNGTWSNDPTGFAYQWLRNGNVIPGQVAPTHALVAADEGTMISCRVTATNNAGNGTATSTAVGPVQPAPAPINITPPQILGTPQVGSAITATAGTWENDPTEFWYWGMRDGAIMGVGSDTPVYTLTPDDEGAMMAVRVRATNEHGGTEAESTPIGPVEPEPSVPDPPPVNTALPVVSGTPQIGHTLSSSPGEWTNNPANYVYQWVRLPLRSIPPPEEPELLDDIPGASNPNYACQLDDVGRRLLCRVTASNSEGEDSADSLPVGPVRDFEWEPPNWLIRDGQVHEYDPLRPRPAYVVPTTDPVFHSVVTRISGNVGGAIPNIPGANWGSVVRHQIMQRQAWNCDQSLIYIQENSGEGAAGAAGLFLLGDLPYTPQFGRHANWPAGADVAWHPTEPDLMDCARGNLYSWFNVRTGVDTPILNVGAGYSNLRIGSAVGNRSTDGKMIVLTATVGGAGVAIPYDIENDVRHPDVIASSVAAGITFNSARASGDGQHIIWNFSGDDYRYTDLAGNLIHSHVPGVMAQGDAGLNAAHEDIFVGRVNASGAGAGPGGTQSAWRMRDAQRTQLTFSSYLYHASLRAADVNFSGHARWACCDSRAIRSGGNISNPPYTCEVVLLPLEGGPAYRLCHNMNGITQDPPALTQPSLSPDGGRCIFASVWNAGDNSGGANPRPVAAYICDYRSALQPPESTPPTNTVRPAITGATLVGSQLICSNGTWTNGSWFARRWRRDDDPIIGATAPSYTTTENDVGHMIDCQVICVSTTGGYTMVEAAKVGPITSPSGPGWNPPSWVIYDRVTRDYSASRPKPGYLQSVPDPNFRSPVIRVSGDPGTTIPNIGGTWGTVCGPNYINHAVWNVDQTLMYILNSGGTSGSIWLDGETYQPRYARGSNWPGGADVRWHMTNPALMNYATGSTFGTYNPATNVRTVIRDFGAAYSDMRIGHNKGNVSLDGRIVVLTAQRAGRLTIIVYNIETNTIINELDPLVVAPGRSASSVWASPSGNYVIWNFSPDNYYITDHNGAQIWDFPTNYISHGDCSFDDVGDETLQGRVNSGSIGLGANGQISKWRIRDGQRTQLTQGGYSPHTSSREMPRNSTYCVAATGDYRTGGNPQHPPFVAEIIMPRLDGTRVYRLCQHHGSNGPEYESYCFAVQSPDSGRVAFRSDWRVGGSTPRPVQAYVVDIRDG